LFFGVLEKSLDSYGALDFKVYILHGFFLDSIGA
jgi:hypothetical protein